MKFIENSVKLLIIKKKDIGLIQKSCIESIKQKKPVIIDVGSLWLRVWDHYSTQKLPTSILTYIVYGKTGFRIISLCGEIHAL